MRLTPMRFKDYVWPHNPRTYTIEMGRDVRERKVPYGWHHLQDLGQKGRVMRGEGEFVGRGAYEEFRKLGKVFYQGGSGILIHPVWQAATVIFAELKLMQEPRADYVRYSFTFLECYDGYRDTLSAAESPGTGDDGAQETGGAAAAGSWYTVARGDTLWDIARRRGMELTELIRMNPQIKNPNLILPGEKVRVA